MSELVLDLVVGIAVPAAAIIVSSWVAVRLARSERLAAAAARADERSEAAFVRTLTALATLNTINLRAEGIAEPMRELRVGLTLLDAAVPNPASRLLAEWFEAERLAGLAQATEAMRRLGLLPDPPRTDADVDAIVAAGGPLNLWARDFANNLRAWRREGASPEQLRTLTTAAGKLH